MFVLLFLIFFATCNFEVASLKIATSSRKNHRSRSQKSSRSLSLSKDHRTVRKNKSVSQTGRKSGQKKERKSVFKKTRGYVPMAVVVSEIKEYISELSILGELGHGWFGTVYRAALADGVEIALKVDRGSKSLDEAEDVEVTVLKAINGREDIGPRLITSFEIITEQDPGTATKMRHRYTLMSLVGSDIKRFMTTHKLKKLPIITAASIAVQIVDAATYLQSVGFVHNDIHPANVAFATPASTSQVVLLDFGIARTIHSFSLSASTVNQFSVETVYNGFVFPEFPNTDLDWFTWVIEGTENDDSIVDLLAGHSWSLLAKVAIRNARIVARIGQNPRSLIMHVKDSVKELTNYAISTIDSKTDPDWFEWTFLDAESEDPIVEYMTNRSVTGAAVGVITETRKLAQFIVNDLLKLGEIGRISKTFLEMTGVKFTDSEFEIKMNEKDFMFAEVLDLASLRTMFLSLVESNNESYQGHILWNN